jgi:DNA polymerase-3 subunit alpha
VLAYQTAWLKAHYPMEFMAALLTSEAGDTDKVVKYIGECRAMGIPVMPPDVNRSHLSFTVHQEGVRFGLSAVKNVGEAAIESILEARGRTGSFTSLQQFCREVDTRRVNKRVVESLVKAGAFDFTGAHRARLLAGLDRAMEGSQQVQRDRALGQGSIFDAFGSTAPEEPLPAVEEFPEHRLLAYEKESLGFYITGNPLARHADSLRLYSSAVTAGLSGLKDGSTVTLGGLLTGLAAKTTKRGETMAVGVLEDIEGTVEVIFFPRTWSKYGASLGGDEPVLVTGKLGLDEKGAKVVVDEVIPLDAAADRVIRKVHVTLASPGLGTEDLDGLKEILRRHHGASPVFLHLVIPERSETLVSLGNGSGIRPSEDFLREMRERFGEESVSLR